MWYILWIYAICILWLDRITKVFSSRVLQDTDVQIWGDWIWFQLAYNSGVAFGLPITGLIQVILTVVTIAGILAYALRFDPIRQNPIAKIAYTSVISGAVANAIDRIMIGKVVDFISVKYFAIFNVADIFITLWAVVLIFLHIQYERDRK